MKTVWLVLLLLFLAPTATLHAQPRINQQHCIKLFPDSYSMREYCEHTEFEEARTASTMGALREKARVAVDAAIHKGVLIKVAKPSTVPLAYIGATYYSLPPETRRSMLDAVWLQYPVGPDDPAMVEIFDGNTGARIGAHYVSFI